MAAVTVMAVTRRNGNIYVSIVPIRVLYPPGCLPQFAGRVKKRGSTPPDDSPGRVLYEIKYVIALRC